MDFARQQRDPTRHLLGIGFVILVHVLVIWALLSGLGNTVIQVIKKPLTATIIEEIKAPPLRRRRRRRRRSSSRPRHRSRSRLTFHRLTW